MKIRQNLTPYFVAASLGLFVFLVYLPAVKNEFVNWDDDAYVYQNQHVRNLDGKFFIWAFSSFDISNWHPLTWVSHGIDYALYGLNPRGHHLTNIVLHVCNTILVFIVMMRLLQANREPAPREVGSAGAFRLEALIASSAVSFCFGIHPQHVESVAWVAERKDLLCALFFLLSVLWYTRYVETVIKPDNRLQPAFISNYRYLLSLGFFLLALMSKPMAVSLPVVLLILDWYPYNRIRSLMIPRPPLIEKLPFMLLSFFSSMITLRAQRSGGSIVSLEQIPFVSRALVSFDSLIEYLVKMAMPFNLIPIYPYPQTISLFSVRYLVSLLLVVGITVFCIANSQKRKWLLATWAYFFVTLIPVLGLVQVGIQSMADRYTYLPSLGPFLLVGLCAGWCWKRLSFRSKKAFFLPVLAVSLTVLITGSLSYLTVRQIGIWKNSLDLWNYVIATSPEQIARAHYNRGVTFQSMGSFERAIDDYDTAVRLNPSYYKSYNNRGVIFMKMRRYEEALRDFDTVISLHPSDSNAQYNRSLILNRPAFR
jgi:protein O-mannosyl-transferase